MSILNYNTKCRLDRSPRLTDVNQKLKSPSCVSTCTDDCIISFSTVTTGTKTVEKCIWFSPWLCFSPPHPPHPPHCLACRDFPQVLASQRSSGIDHKWQPHSEAASSPHSHNTSSSLPLCHLFSLFVSWRKQTQLITMGASNSAVFIFSLVFGLVGLLFR